MSLQEMIANSFEAFAHEHPVEAYDMDREAFYAIQMKKSRNITREDIDDIINEMKSYKPD